MNLLFITPYIPFPLTEGGKISQFAMIDYLRNYHSITLLLTAYTNENLADIAQLKNIWPNVDIQVIDMISVTTDRKTFSLRLKGILKHLKQVLIKSKSVSVNNNDFDNNHLINTPFVKSRDFVTKLNTAINAKIYDLIQIDIIDYADLIYIIPSHIKTVFVHHELKFARLNSSANKETNLYEKYITNYVKNSEAALLNNFNSIITFSEIDKQKLESIYGFKSKVYSSPFPILQSNFSKPEEKLDRIEKLVFVGGDGHSPNTDAIFWYANEIYPLIKNSINLKLHVIGKWSIENIRLILNKCGNNVVFTGFVDDINLYCKNSIMIVPLLTGSGIRTKILYSMAHKLPIISTSIGCEGISVADKKSIIIADTSNEFSNAIQSLYEDLPLANEIATNAYQLAVNKYSQQAAGDLRNKILQEIVSNK